MSRGHADADSDRTRRALARLRSEIDGSGASDEDGPAQVADEQLAAAIDTAYPDTDIWFEEAFVKRNLEEILLALVAGRSVEANGSRLQGDLERLFGADLSPGTVYPELYDIEESGLLERQELVRTKEYSVADRESVREALAAEMEQQLALGLFYRRCLAGFPDGDAGERTE